MLVRHRLMPGEIQKATDFHFQVINKNEIIMYHTHVQPTHNNIIMYDYL